jgi:hypothetical protein
MIRPTFLLLFASTAVALDYPHVTAEPQKTGWPLTAEERAYVIDKPEYERRPGRESNKHLPQLWPQVPSAGHFGGDSWLKLHEAHVKTVQANQGPIDVLLVGDSITIQWGDSWKKHFPDLKAVNIGIGGDKTQNVLWRLDHGGVEGLQPKAIVLMIGNNNMFFTPETSVEAATKGIEMCLKNLREKFPRRRHHRGEDSARSCARQSLLRRHQEDQRRPRSPQARQRTGREGARPLARLHQRGWHDQERPFHGGPHPSLARRLCGVCRQIEAAAEIAEIDKRMGTEE